MGCENKSCDKCACEDKNTVPETLPESRVVYVERQPTSFWSFFWGMAIGTLFFGC
jgi:hypothetical protein